MSFDESYERLLKELSDVSEDARWSGSSRTCDGHVIYRPQSHWYLSQQTSDEFAHSALKSSSITIVVLSFLVDPTIRSINKPTS